MTFEDWSDDEDENGEESLESRETANERSNDHIEQYVRQYIEDERAPEHAVMITGRWGIGKSHFVKGLVERYAKADDQQQYIYLSLNGLQNTSDMDAAVAVAMHPILGTKAAKVIIKSVAVGLKRFRIDPDVKVSSVANKLGAKLYVFDDLERCEAPIQTTLGYINRFVESAGCRVVVVAHEEALIRKEKTYPDIKEKIVGQSFSFQPVIRRPLQQFIAQLKSERVRNILDARFDSILKQYAQSDLNNLRILRQSIWDFGRFAENLTDEQLASTGLIDSLLGTFLPFSFDYRAGNRIEPSEIANSGTLVLTGLSQQKESVERWKKLSKRYPQNTFRDRVLLGEMWADILVDGFTDRDALRAACDSSKFIAGKPARASWQRLWDKFDEADADVDQLIADVESKFQKREYVIPGEFLHVVGIRLGLAKDGVFSQSLADVAAECRQYIDDLYAAGSIGVDNPDGLGVRGDGHGGMMIQNRETAEYRDVLNYYKVRRAAFEVANLPEAAAKLLEELRTNVPGFIEKVCYTNRGSYIYRDTPILAHMNVDDFADALLATAPANQLAAFSSVRERYDGQKLTGSLASEKDFLVQLRDRLLQLAQKRTGFGRVRIQRYTQYHISKVIDASEAGQDEEAAD